MMNQEEFRDKTTNRCTQFMPRNGKMMIMNVEDQETYDFYRNAKCVKGNPYATACDYCAAEECIYFNPEVNLVPVGQGQMVIMEPDEVEKYLAAKAEKGLV